MVTEEVAVIVSGSPSAELCSQPVLQLCSSVLPSGSIYGRMSRGARQDCQAKGALLCRLPPLPLSVSLPAFTSPAALCVLEHDNRQLLLLRLQGCGNCTGRDALPQNSHCCGNSLLPFPLQLIIQVSCSSGLSFDTNTDFFFSQGAGRDSPATC